MMRVRRLSVAYIGPNSRTERPGETKISTEVAQVTRDSYTTTLNVKGQLAGGWGHTVAASRTACHAMDQDLFGVTGCSAMDQEQVTSSVHLTEDLGYFSRLSKAHFFS